MKASRKCLKVLESVMLRRPLDPALEKFTQPIELPLMVIQIVVDLHLFVGYED